MKTRAAAVSSRCARADGLQVAVDFAPPLHQIIIHLQSEKKPLRQTEVACEPQIGVGGDIALAEHDLVDAARSDVNGTCQGVLAEGHRLKELFEQDFAGVMIVNFPDISSSS